MGGIDMPLETDPNNAEVLSAKAAVVRYRQTHPEIVNGWKVCQMPLETDPNNAEVLSAKAAVVRYRQAHPEIVNGWKVCQRALEAIYAGEEMQIDPWGMCFTCAEGIRTPVGMIRYPNLRQEEVKDDSGNPTGKYEWVYGEGRHRARIYGPKVVENIVQHLARCILVGMMLDIKHRFKLAPKLSVHDESVYVVKEPLAVQALNDVQSVMRTPPKWWPELVVWSEGDIGSTYGEAK